MSLGLDRILAKIIDMKLVFDIRLKRDCNLNVYLYTFKLHRVIMIKVMLMMIIIITATGTT